LKKAMRRMARQLGWDRNPLRRRVDRVEAAVLTGLFAVFLIGAPALMIAAARVTDSAGLRQQHAERAWQQVPATLLQTAVTQAGPSYGWDGARASARWTAPDGQRRTGLVAVDSSAVAGQHVAVWVDAAGRITRSPLSRYDNLGNIVLATVTAPIIMAAALAIAGGCARVVVNRRRLACWDRAWHAVGPRWTRSP